MTQQFQCLKCGHVAYPLPKPVRCPKCGSGNGVIEPRRADDHAPDPRNPERSSRRCDQ